MYVSEKIPFQFPHHALCCIVCVIDFGKKGFIWSAPVHAFLFAWFVSLFPSFLSAFLGAPAPHSFAKGASKPEAGACTRHGSGRVT